MLSPEPVTTLVESQLQSIVQTTPECPSNEPNRSPSFENQMLGDESLAAENRRSPSRLYLIWVMARSWPCNEIGFLGKSRWWLKKEKIISPLNRLIDWFSQNKTLNLISDYVYVCVCVQDDDALPFWNWLIGCQWMKMKKVQMDLLMGSCGWWVGRWIDDSPSTKYIQVLFKLPATLLLKTC